VQYVEKKFIGVDYTMLIQNHVYYNMLSKENTLWGSGAMIKDLTFQCGGEEFKPPTFAT
jgi:hypothetical protein